MGAPRAVQVALFMSLIATCVAVESSRKRITVRKYRTNYRVDSWDDDRENPYGVTFWKYGLKSVYTFDTLGNMKTLKARDTKYTFHETVGSRMLVDSDDDAEGDVDVDFASEVVCTVCHVTWSTLCDRGIADVCSLDKNPRADFDEDAQDSLGRMCSAFGAACETSAFDVCDGQCTEGTAPEPTPAPASENTLAPSPNPTPALTSEPTTAPPPEPTPPPSTEPTEPPTPEPVVAPTSNPVASPISEPTAAPTAEVLVAPRPNPTTASTPEPVAAPTVDPNTPSTPEPTTAPTPESTAVRTREPTTAPISDPTPVPIAEATPAPTIEVVPVPTPAPSFAEPDACNPNPCKHEGSCSIDPAGGHVCSCATDFGGMACQTNTSSLAPFYIEIDYNGTWTDARKAIFQSAANRWAEVITHVPCGGTPGYPAGRLLITSTLQEIDGVDGTLGSAGPSSFWTACPTISATGRIKFDIDDIAILEEEDIFEGVILHEMGHAIGFGSMWGADKGNCTTCKTDDNPSWTCPAALHAYYHIGGTGADIVELDGGSGTSCGHLDEDIFTDELMTGYIDTIMYLSKITAAIFDDLHYIVDPSAVDEYILPSERDGSLNAEPPKSTGIFDTAVESVVYLLDGEGNVVDEIVGVMMEF